MLRGEDICRKSERFFRTAKETWNDTNIEVGGAGGGSDGVPCPQRMSVFFALTGWLLIQLTREQLLG